MEGQAFAFGCFHFGLRRSPPENFTISTFLEEIEETLKAISNVDNVAVDCDPDFYDKPLSYADEPPDFSKGDVPFPVIQDERIVFDLLIPFRLQEELGRAPLTFTERFRVEMRYLFQMPVTIFYLLSPEEEPKPSEAVIIIRRLLEREFRRQPESVVDFQFLGPSPFHADFYLTAEDEDFLPRPWAFDVSVSHERGYDRLNFLYNRERFEDSDEALHELLLDLTLELDMYYSTVLFEREEIYSWEELQTTSQALASLYQGTGMRAFFTRIFKTSHLVNSAFVALTSFESNSIFTDNMLRERYRNTYSADTPAYLREFIDNRMDNRARYPTEQISALVQLFETRRLSAAELRVVVISAISGGAFGALVTALFGGS